MFFWVMFDARDTPFDWMIPVGGVVLLIRTEGF